MWWIPYRKFRYHRSVRKRQEIPYVPAICWYNGNDNDKTIMIRENGKKIEGLGRGQGIPGKTHISYSVPLVKRAW